jgi:hypothetical protein
LATARKKLAARLARYGLAFSVASLAALLAENTASACVPAALSSAGVKAAMLVAAGPAALGVVSTNVTTLTEGVRDATSPPMRCVIIGASYIRRRNNHRFAQNVDKSSTLGRVTVPSAISL